MEHEYSIGEVFRALNEAEEKHAPKKIFVRGNIDLLRQGARISVIGSRKPSEDGIKRARKLSKLLVSQGIVVVSGLAEGVDTAAHQAAIEAGGKTIAVLGTPVDDYYPQENKELQMLIERDHLVISQFPNGYPTLKGNFPIRNRFMALISDATVIVEAKDGSGTTHQGWEALRLARPLIIPESAILNPLLKWPQQFLKYGAQILTNEPSSFEFIEEQISSVDAPINNEIFT